MRERLIYLLSFVSALSLVGNAQAVTMNWTNAGGDQNWFTASNWDIGLLPTSADTAMIKILPGPTIANEGALGGVVRVGAGSGAGALTVDGGTLTTATNVHMAQTVSSEGTLDMISGSMTVGSNFIVGLSGLATLNMTGGDITVASDFRIANDSTAKGHVNLDGGIISANNFQMRPQPGAVGTMNIRGGTLIVNGDMLSTVQGYIDNGWITAYEGNGTLQLDYDATNPGRTTLKAVHMLNPNPADGGSVSPGAVELSWTLPDPCVPGQPVAVDVYLTDNLQTLEQFLDPAAIRVVNKQNVTSVVVQTQPKTRYYWAVDTYIGAPNDPIYGPIFSFSAVNLPPEVDAGADIVTWLQDGLRTGSLDATVIHADAYTVQWTVVSEPNAGDAVIQTATVEDTSVTLSATGQYVLQLEASDGEYTGSDTVTITAYNDSCEAAQSVPGYQPLVGDLNGDCRVDDTDLALLQENWLKDNSLTQDWFPLP